MRKHRINLAFFIALIMGFLCHAIPLVQAEDGLTAKIDPYTGQVVVRENEQSVLQYNYQFVPTPAENREKRPDDIYDVARSDYIHPLYGLHGEQLTKDWALDHAHHRGIYWAWPEVGYQGEYGDLHALQNVFARPVGDVQWAKVDGKMRITAVNRWFWKQEIPIVRETAFITVHPSGQDGRFVDLKFQFTGLVDEVTLARRVTKFYGGLNFRMQPIREMILTASPRAANPQQAAQQAAWCLASGFFEGNPNRVEITIFEKQTNPQYPGDIIQYPDLPWIQPTFPKAGTRYTLKKDETLTLEYRFWIHENGMDDATRQRMWELFQTTEG